MFHIHTKEHIYYICSF